MQDRTARVRLTPKMLKDLQEGRTVLVRLPKYVSMLQISTTHGDVFEQVNRLMDNFWKEFEGLWKRFSPRK